MLLAKLTRGLLMQTFKQIAHDAGAGEPLLLGNLLHWLAGGEELFRRFIETQSGDVLHKTYADFFTKQARQPGFGDKFVGGAIATGLGWRWIFVFSIAVALVALLLRGTPESRSAGAAAKAGYQRSVESDRVAGAVESVYQ
jgi:hypothetical protein